MARAGGTRDETGVPSRAAEVRAGEEDNARSAAIRAPGRRRAALLGLTAAMGVAALNIWTGAPLVALWVGSQAQGGGHPTMTSVAVVVLVYAVLGYGLVALLSRLGGLHDRIAGMAPTVRVHVPWLRSMRGERPLYAGETARLTALERVLVVTVVIVTVAFEVWFLFYSTSPIDSRTGRAGVEPPARLATGMEGSAAQGGRVSARLRPRYGRNPLVAARL